jgi:hypothetical protein
MSKQRQDSCCETAVALIFFNRPECTQRVMRQIRQARPRRLYLIADAARPGKQGEPVKCVAARQSVESQIDWPCTVRKNYAETNLGCRRRIVSGLDWLFEQEQDAIILEDDILPDPTFFDFCSAMLAQYRNDSRVMLVGGFNEINYRPKGGISCFFTQYTPIWGWATWCRAWKLYQSNRLAWDNDEQLLRQNSCSPQEAELLISRLKQVEAGQLDTWDYHWRAAVLVQNGVCVVPARNLVQNIGFGPGATHTVSPLNRMRFKKGTSLPGPYRCPELIAPDERHDQLLSHKRVFSLRVDPWKDIFLRLFARRT